MTYLEKRFLPGASVSLISAMFSEMTWRDLRADSFFTYSAMISAAVEAARRVGVKSPMDAQVIIESSFIARFLMIWISFYQFSTGAKCRTRARRPWYHRKI